MATPGNFGGGSTGPDHIFLGITRATPSAPGRGRAQSPVRVKLALRVSVTLNMLRLETFSATRILYRARRAQGRAAPI
jgi:hypothetical protein